MLTAHLPSGYCLARLAKADTPLLLPAALCGAVLPDIDMLFFYFVDNGAIHHHRYWVHIPAFWALVATVTLPLLGKTRYRSTGIVFFSAIFLHLVLDSVGGGIMWLYPFRDTLIEFVEVPASRSHWIWSFVFHWTIALEFAIWFLAIWLWLKDFRTRSV